MGHCSGWQSGAHKDRSVPALPACHSTPPAPYCSRTDSSSKQICCNSTCNLALDWEQIEQVLCVVGNKRGVCVCVEGKEREIYWKGRGKEMISGSFMWGKVGLLSVGAPRQESYYYRKLEQPSPALHLDKIHLPKKKRDRKRETNTLVCIFTITTHGVLQGGTFLLHVTCQPTAPRMFYLFIYLFFFYGKILEKLYLLNLA